MVNSTISDWSMLTIVSETSRSIWTAATQNSESVLICKSATSVTWVLISAIICADGISASSKIIIHNHKANMMNILPYLQLPCRKNLHTTIAAYYDAAADKIAPKKAIKDENRRSSSSSAFLTLRQTRRPGK